MVKFKDKAEETRIASSCLDFRALSVKEEKEQKRRRGSQKKKKDKKNLKNRLSL